MIFEKVAEILADKTDKNVADITMDTTFADLNMDSLDTVDVLMGMEDDFGVTIEMSEDIKTIGDVVKIIEAGKA